MFDRRRQPPGLSVEEVEIVRTWARGAARVQPVYAIRSRAIAPAAADAPLDLVVVVGGDRADPAPDYWRAHSATWSAELAARLPFPIVIEKLEADGPVAIAVREHGLLIYGASLDRFSG